MSTSNAVVTEPGRRLAELLSRVSRKNALAFAELHALTKNKMSKTVFAVGATACDIDDILQEGYLKIWRNAASFDLSRASAIAWMCTIMRNTAIDAVRARKLPALQLEEALSVPNPDYSQDGDFDVASAEPIAMQALSRLPEERRRLITLAYIEGESRASLSQRFGVPVGTIKTWLRRTLETVRNECTAATVRTSCWSTP
jgi:RNA polymerase sigma-70 factor, ECF subfamily